jgi:hypothetical protein
VFAVVCSVDLCTGIPFLKYPKPGIVINFGGGVGMGQTKFLLCNRMKKLE